ncbi:hypothetical protein LCGC14_1973380 [marine sediment metagenome]|uniref:Uncharacterized protein n=1 Tax=marine sediment metagenome TaxID=412755 RepID=A0A0F9HPF0_9ZZZZ
MSKTTRDYVVAIEIKFSTVPQAEEFVTCKTPAGERIALDIEDEEIIDLFDTSDGMVAELDYPGRLDGIGELIQAELLAAVKCGADFRLKLKWEAS